MVWYILSDNLVDRCRYLVRESEHVLVSLYYIDMGGKVLQEFG